MSFLLYVFYVFLAILPSLIWLFWFLRKDKHPEPKKEIIKVFLLGGAVSLPVLLIELGLLKVFSDQQGANILFSLLYIFLGVAFVEEFFKYLVVKIKVLNSPEFDEPIDAMLYMIIVALGFAAIENILLFMRPDIFFEPFDPFKLTLIRFLGATFLHALCSAIIGFFLALSLIKLKSRFILLTFGLVLATSLHGLYNFSIINIGESYQKLQELQTTGQDLVPAKLEQGLSQEYLKQNIIVHFWIVVIILVGLAIFVAFGLRRLKKLKSICEI